MRHGERGESTAFDGDTFESARNSRRPIHIWPSLDPPAPPDRHRLRRHRATSARTAGPSGRSRERAVARHPAVVRARAASARAVGLPRVTSAVLTHRRCRGSRRCASSPQAACRPGKPRDRWAHASRHARVGRRLGRAGVVKAVRECLLLGLASAEDGTHRGADRVHGLRAAQEGLGRRSACGRRGGRSFAVHRACGIGGRRLAC